MSDNDKNHLPAIIIGALAATALGLGLNALFHNDWITFIGVVVGILIGFGIDHL